MIIIKFKKLQYIKWKIMKYFFEFNWHQQNFFYKQQNRHLLLTAS